MEIIKVLSLPATLAPNTIYATRDGESGSILHLTNRLGSVVFSTPSLAVIDSRVASVTGGIVVYPTYAAMTGATAPTTNVMIHVIDATGDTTVLDGGATYLYVVATTSYVKISEFESMDLILTWENILNKPAVLATLSETAGKLYYNSAEVAMASTATQEW